MVCTQQTLHLPPLDLFVLLPLFFLIETSACTEMLRWNLRQESPIPLKCWHSNKSLLFHQHLSHKFGFLEVCSQACIRLQENRLIVAGSLKLFSMDFSVTVVSIIYLNICNYRCVSVLFYYSFLYICLFI